MDCSDLQQRQGCKMDGFIASAEAGNGCTGTGSKCSPCTAASTEACLDAVGYHTAVDIPNYWTYAHDFALQDHMFGAQDSGSLPAHLYAVSGWSAYCTNPYDPKSCANSLNPNPSNGQLQYAWTDLTYLLHKHRVSWRYYIFEGADGCEQSCGPGVTPGIWNPLPSFTDVKIDAQDENVRSIRNFYSAAYAGTLPAVSWIAPSHRVSEHPIAFVTTGESYVTRLINAVMQSPDWSSTAIFLTWDDWGGFYDNAVPPQVDQNGYGLRVPSLVISPYAKQGFIDHQTLSFDAYLKFIEDDFLNGQRLNPSTDGRPDPRPDVREKLPLLGNLKRDFNFAQQPRGSVILPVCPATDLQPPPSC
jgi:phospholipase C